ncbi:MAG: transcription-repair coupling factor, partial [Azospirillum brasilense]
MTATIPTPKPGELLELAHVPFAAQALVLTRLAREQKRPLVHVGVQDKDCEALAALCQFLAPEIPLYLLPAWDTLPYDRVSPSPQLQSQRLATLSAMAQAKPGTPYIVLTTLNAATQMLPPKDMVEGANFSVRTGATLDRDALLKFLTDNGYSRTGKVMEAGEYAVRGSLIDLFPAGAEVAIRIDLFGDEVESLRSFDPLTQVSDATVPHFTLGPVSEVLLQADTIERFRTRYRELFGSVTKDDPLYESISAGRPYPGMEHWLPLFYDRLGRLSDYAPEAMLCHDHRISALHQDRWDTVMDYYGARQQHEKLKDAWVYHPVPPEKFFVDPERLVLQWQHAPRLLLTPYAPTAGGVSLNILSSPQLHTKRPGDERHPGEVVQDYLA